MAELALVAQSLQQCPLHVHELAGYVLLEVCPQILREFAAKGGYIPPNEGIHRQHKRGPLRVCHYLYNIVTAITISVK